MAWLSVSESTAEARKRPTRRWDASITAVRNRDRHRRTPARAPIVGSESAAQAEALDQRTVALDVDLLQVLEHAATLTDQEQQATTRVRSEEHTSELQSRGHLVCRLLLEKKKNKT